jgi:hypothetical protein
MEHSRKLGGSYNDLILVRHISKLLALNDLYSSPASEADLVNTAGVFTSSMGRLGKGTYSCGFWGSKAHIESQVAKYASLFA